MEVASPLTFSHTSAGSKRQFPCTPNAFDSTPCNPYIDSADDFVHQRSFKRRRFTADESMEGDSENIVNHSPFISHTPLQKPFQTSTHSLSLKRSRIDSINYDLQGVVNSQEAEIQSLKSDKQNLESSMSSLKTEHEKILNENKILKRAVTIQQERQNQAAAEIDAAHKFKFVAEDRIKKLEQIILKLRYHLQTQQTNPGNDFMGFPPRPPDVY